MSEKKSGLSGLKESLGLGKIMSKISEVVDGKKSMPEMNEDDVIGCRIKEMRDELDALQKTHGVLRDHIRKLSQSLAMLLDDVIKEREASCDLDDDIASPSVNQEADTESSEQPPKAASAEKEPEEVIVLASDSAEETKQDAIDTSEPPEEAQETVAEKTVNATEEQKKDS